MAPDAIDAANSAIPEGFNFKEYKSIKSTGKINIIF
jgi:hypothetical protein